MLQSIERAEGTIAFIRVVSQPRQLRRHLFRGTPVRRRVSRSPFGHSKSSMKGSREAAQALSTIGKILTICLTIISVSLITKLGT